MNYTKLIILAGSEHVFGTLEQMLHALILKDFGIMVAQVWIDTTSVFNFLMVSVIFITGFKKKV